MHSPCKCKNQSSVQFFRINREKIGSFWFFENFGKLRLDFITTQTSDQSQSCAFNAEIKRQIRYIYTRQRLLKKHHHHHHKVFLGYGHFFVQTYISHPFEFTINNLQCNAMNISLSLHFIYTCKSWNILGTN